MTSRIIFDSKYAGETVTLNFDFISKLGTATISGTPTFSISIWSGNENPISLTASGAVSVSGTVASQKVAGGKTGIIYLVQMKAVSSDGQTLVLEGLLFVAPDGM